jgi:shikimate kinase
MKNIFLIGLPSSGKTTLGKELARHLRYRFIDTDRLIVKQTGLEIVEIFAQKGEDYFRELERDMLRAIRPNSKLVVATGGGMPCFFDNITYLKDHGISIFLDVPPAQILERIQRHATNDRPLYQKEDTQLLQTLQQKYDDRLPFYVQAHVRVSGGDIKVKDIMEQLKAETFF